MKKVLILAASLQSGGAEKFCRDIALCAPNTYEFHYIVFDMETHPYEAAVKAAGCTVFHFPPPGGHYINYVHSLIALMKREGYAAVHGHNMFGCGLFLWAAARAGIPVRIAHAHSELREGGALRRAYEAVMGWLIRRYATHCLACSDGAGRRLFGVRPWRTIPNGIHRELFQFDGEKRREFRRKYGLEGFFVIGHAGHLNRVKNQKFLLSLLPALQKHRRVKLLLLGDGPDRDLLEGEIHRLKLDDSVFMPGNVEEIPPFYFAMDAFCLPSLYEGMPLALLEARCAGLRCVISDCVSCRAPGITALPLEDPAAWVAALSAINGRLPGEVLHVRDTMASIYEIYEGESL